MKDDMLFNEEILNTRLKQLVLNLTCNYNSSGYKLENVYSHSFSFVPVNISEKDRYKYQVELRFECNSAFEKNLLNIEELFKNPYSQLTVGEENNPVHIQIYVGTRYYSVKLSRIEEALVLDALQKMVTEYEDNLTYKVLQISENKEIESVDDLD